MCVCVCVSCVHNHTHACACAYSSDKQTAGRRDGDRRDGGGEGHSSLPAAGPFVVGVPVLLLTLDGAVGRVPAAVVHGLLLAVVALQPHRGRRL